MSVEPINVDRKPRDVKYFFENEDSGGIREGHLTRSARGWQHPNSADVSPSS
jgi:hypothetical protein